MPSNSVPTRDERYAALFQRYWKAGTGLPQTGELKSWTNHRFIDAIFSKGASSLDPDTVAKWCNGALPSARYAPLILEVFFSEKSPENLRCRDEMHAIWKEADELRSRNRSRLRPRYTMATEEWIFSASGGSRLAAVRLHPLKTGNSEGSYYLEASVLVDIAEYKLEEPVSGGKRFAIGVDRVHLAFSSDGYQIGKQSIIGERIILKHIRPLPDGVEICCPQEGECLSGDLLGEHQFARLEATGGPKNFIELTLRAVDRCFCVFKLDERGNRERISLEREAVLNAVIYKMRKEDGHGRVLLATARMDAKGDT